VVIGKASILVYAPPYFLPFGKANATVFQSGHVDTNFDKEGDKAGVGLQDDDVEVE